MKKILITIIALFLFVFSVEAKSAKRDLSAVINESQISKNSVAISVINADNGKEVYGLNQGILMHPASVQKLITIIPAAETLGEDYNFSTKLYLRGNDTYIIKLGADPYLRYEDLEYLTGKIDKKQIKKICIDDSIIEKKDWGEGWQWDDNLNTHMPKFNAYNLDKNLISVTVIPAGALKPSFIINPSKYPIVFFNNTVYGNKNDISITRDNSVSSNAITISGTVNSPVSITFPISNTRRYFITKLIQAMEENEIYLKQPVSITKITPEDKEIDSVCHPISNAITDILKNSNNMVSETLTKVASEKAYNETGTDTLGIKLFNDYCKKISIDTNDIRIVDASGVSKNNVINADFITQYLFKNKNNKIYENMAHPGEGTLSNRMMPIASNLRAKTGTLADISSIAGFLTAKNGKKYIFCIMINDPKSSDSDKKTLEDYLIREMFINL